ncbi:MAG: hypothetical protein QOE58_3284 [Actinomycetota bacterium]|jgi:endonuclease/exonuclease/phosphatase (EEP) superfamily protein YafD|nr:hypothetical protein [Actinomycetota bacterium]
MKNFGGRLLSFLLWIGLAVAVPLVAMRWVDTTIGPMVVLQSVLPLAGIPVALVLVPALLTRRWTITAAAGVLLTVCAVVAAPSVIGNTVAPGSDDFVVMSANLRYGSADAQSVVSAVREHRVDVLVLLEITPAAVERLRGAGLDVLLPETVGQSIDGSLGVVVRGRFPMTLAEPISVPRPGDIPAEAAYQPVVTLHRASGDVALRAVHSQTPLLTGAEVWRAGLADLQTWRERQPSDKPLVMAGDFNSSWGHPGFRGIAETMTDAHRAAGEGWVRTWPQGRRLIRPFVQLDHVLVRGLSVVEAGVVTLPNTDHAAVWARLSPHA